MFGKKLGEKYVLTYPPFSTQLRNMDQTFNFSPKSLKRNKAAEPGDVGNLAVVNAT